MVLADWKNFAELLGADKNSPLRLSKPAKSFVTSAGRTTIMAKGGGKQKSGSGNKATAQQRLTREQKQLKKYEKLVKEKDTRLTNLKMHIKRRDIPTLVLARGLHWWGA